MSVMLYPCIFCCSVNRSVCFICCVFDSVCELFGDLFSVAGGALLDRPCMVF